MLFNLSLTDQSLPAVPYKSPVHDDFLFVPRQIISLLGMLWRVKQGAVPYKMSFVNHAHWLHHKVFESTRMKRVAVWNTY